MIQDYEKETNLLRKIGFVHLSIAGSIFDSHDATFESTFVRSIDVVSQRFDRTSNDGVFNDAFFRQFNTFCTKTHPAFNRIAFSSFSTTRFLYKFLRFLHLFRLFIDRSVKVYAKKEKMMWEALREAIDEEMELNPRVLVIGEACFPFSMHFIFRGGRWTLRRELQSHIRPVQEIWRNAFARHADLWSFLCHSW